jgi:hypothetical protein
VWGGRCLCLIGGSGLLGIALWQRWFWWPYVSDWAGAYFWHRVAYAVVTTVEFPMVQFGLIGGWLLILSGYTRTLSQRIADLQPTWQLPDDGNVPPRNAGDDPLETHDFDGPVMPLEAKQP